MRVQATFWHASAGWLAWSWRCRRWVAVVVAGAIALYFAELRVEAAGLMVLCWLLPFLCLSVWAVVWPVSYEARVDAPLRQRRWRRWAKTTWPLLARRCGLSVSGKRDRKDLHGQSQTVSVWHDPRLRAVSSSPSQLSLTVDARLGQTVEALEAAAGAVRDAARAQSARCLVVSPGRVRFDLVMRDQLVTPATGAMPEPASPLLVGEVPMGRTQLGELWRLRLLGLHTLIVGASGSGKGSLLWGILCNLGPAISAGLVRVYGIDLKYGVELSMGRPLFTSVATTEKQALAVLRKVDRLVRTRGEAMAGHSRDHVARPGAPFVILAIDEIASLTAYMSDREMQKEADRLLRSILTKGRAMGVAVVGALQDPRKETLPSRGLFTQTVALRLRSREEVTMVLGDGTAEHGPAHRISAGTPGMGYVQSEDGSLIRVRAVYWPDALIRQVAARYRSAQEPIPVEAEPENRRASGQAAQSVPSSSAGHGRRPRSPRKPRAPRASRSGDESKSAREARDESRRSA